MFTLLILSGGCLLVVLPFIPRFGQVSQVFLVVCFVPVPFKCFIYCRVVRELEKFSDGPLHVRGRDTALECSGREGVELRTALYQVTYRFVPFTTPLQIWSVAKPILV